MTKKKIMLGIGIIMVICVTMGLSYAYWRFTFSQTGTNYAGTRCFDLAMTNEANNIHLESTYPISDEEGRQTIPYSFTIENTCEIFASYTITLEVTKESTLSSSYIASMLNSNEILTLNELEQTTVSDETLYKEAYILGTGSLGNGDSEDYTLRLWMDYDTPASSDTMNQTFEAKVIITANAATYSPVDYGFTTLHDAILANEYQVVNLQTSIDKINQKQEPDFTQTAPIMEWQEFSQDDTSTVSYTMPDPADVGSGKDYASNLTNENIYPAFATSYTFNQEEGKYYLSDFIYQDPSNIDFSKQDYYICDAGTSITSANQLSPYNTTNCTTMYQISEYTSSTSATISGSDRTSYPATKYTFIRVRTYSQTEVESDKSDKGLYAMNDNDGTSYYYRGSVNNNYVYFGGFYWRIIRINGDGSIRLLYAGTTKDATGESAQIGTSAFNTNRNLPLYVGYMYGNTSGSTIEEVNANTNDSTIKTYLDQWYQANLNEYSSYIADSGFCNDRTLSTRNNNGNGIQTNIITYYAAYDRYYTNYSPSLNCPDASSDLFTLIGNTKGNQALNYPIGLITIDELMLAGARNGYINKLYYPFSGASYWTMSSNYYNSGELAAVGIGPYYDGSMGGIWVTSSNGVRPVINLNTNVEITGGIGTKNEPFVIKTA